MLDFGQLKSAIERTLDDGGKKRRQALLYLIEYPDEVAMLSMRKLATRAKVSPAMMTKISSEFKFDDFSQMKAVFQEHVLGTSDYFSAGARKIQTQGSRDNTSNFLFKIARCDLENIEQIFSATREPAIDSAVDEICGADRIYIIGMRACFSVAHYLHYSLSLIRDNIELISSYDGRLGDHALKMTSNDLLIVIGFRPYVNVTIDVVNQAKRVGMKVIAMTDNRTSPLIVDDNQALLFATKSPWVFGSITSAIVLSQVLVAKTLLRGGEQALQRLVNMETELKTFNVFSS